MFRKFSLALLTAASLAGASFPALASGDDVSAEKAAQIRTTLEGQGYEVRKIKAEDGMFEAYALKDGQRMEIYLDADLKIVRTKDED